MIFKLKKKNKIVDNNIDKKTTIKDGRIRNYTNKDICCDMYGLSNPFLTNVVEEELARKKIKATLAMISKFEASTMGPYGSTTIIQDREKNHLATKDGYDLLGRIVFDDEVSRTVLDILRNIAGSQVTTVGDGSTSSIIVAQALYSALVDENNRSHLLKKVSPKDILSILNALEPMLEEYVKKEARPISEDYKELDMIATVANNNDKETGKNVAELYREIGPNGFITTDVKDTYPVDTVEYKEGISWNSGYIDKCFTVSSMGKTVTHENPLLFLTNMAFTQESLPLLMDVIGHALKIQKDLVIVCNAVDSDALTFFKKNRTKHLGTSKPEIPFTVVDIDQVTHTGISTLKDLALLTGCEIYDPITGGHSHPYFIAHENSFFGKAKRAIINDKETQIICDEELLSEEELKKKSEKIVELEKDIAEYNKIEDRTGQEETELFYLKVEYNYLLGHSAIYHVGGKTLTERASRERLIDDAIKACRSAIKYGFVPGGNLIIPKVIKDNEKEIAKKLSSQFEYLSVPTNTLEEFFVEFINIIRNAFLVSYRCVLNNAYFDDEEIDKIITKCTTENKFYNLKLHRYEDFATTNIINSTDTDLQIMRSCISIIGILATSNQFITLNYNLGDNKH